MKNIVFVCAITSALLALSSCAVAGYQPAGYAVTTLAPDADIDRAMQRGTSEAVSSTLWAQAAQDTQTATARAYAAGMTATRDAAGAQATGTALIAAAAYSQTAHALGAMQTQVAITLTAAAAISVEVAAREAARTATENYFTSGARVSAEMTQVASDAKAAERIDMAWTVLAWSVVIMLVLGVLTLVVLGVLYAGAGVSGRWARANGEHAATYHRWYPQAAQGAEPEQAAPSVVGGADDEEIRQARWYRAIEMFLRAGEKHGFSLSALSETRKIVSQPAWQAITQWLRHPSVGVLRLAGVGGTTTWAIGWDIGQALEAVRNRTIPCPTGEAVEVATVVNATTKTTAKQPENTSSAT